jgi:hypothetical protein
MIITLKGADFSASNIGTLSSWRISRSLGSGATYEGVTSVDKGAAFSATVTLAEGYEVGTAGVTITMGGIVLSGAHSISGNVITITIASVTGNVLIKVPTVNTAGGDEPDVPVEPEVPESDNFVWVIGTTDPNGTWTSTPEYHRAALYTTTNTGKVALDIDNNTNVDSKNVPSGLTGKLYLPKIPEGATQLSWSNSDNNVLEAVWLRDSNGEKIAAVNTSYSMASPIDLTKYPTAVYWNCDCKYGASNATMCANSNNDLPGSYDRYQIVCNTTFTFS